MAVCPVHTRFVLCQWKKKDTVHAPLALSQCRSSHFLSESLLRPDSIRSSLRFFNMFKIHPRPRKTIKIASCPFRCLLRSFYVLQVRTASDRFYIGVVGTWSSVTGILPKRFDTDQYQMLLKESSIKTECMSFNRL